MRLLIVDGDISNRQSLMKLGAQWGYECCSAETEKKALSILKTMRFDIVISEWRTDIVDGTQICEQLRESKQEGYTYLIICSDKRETKQIVEAFDAGADDYIAKPFEAEELRARIEAGLRLLCLDRSLKSAKARLERGLKQAALTLKSMLPHRRDDEHFRTDWLFRPCAIIGGDLFNMVDLDEDHVCLYAVDVSGHEIAAALFAVTLGHMLMPRRQAIISGERRQTDSYSWNQSPRQVVSTLNDRFEMEPPMNMYATLFYAVINRKTLKMRWVRAGHPSPIIIRKGKRIVLKEGEPPIGVFSDCNFTEHSTQLEKRDRLVLYSDGISECQNLDTLEMMGFEKFTHFMETLSERPFNEMVPAIDKALIDHRRSVEFDDDLSLLAVEIK
jgi:phosphoserine phosphatase RsbU/P